MESRLTLLFVIMMVRRACGSMPLEKRLDGRGVVKRFAEKLKGQPKKIQVVW